MEMDLKNISFNDDGAPEPAELPENSGTMNHAVAAIMSDKLFASKPDIEVIPPLPTLRSLLNKSDAGDMNKTLASEEDACTTKEVAKSTSARFGEVNFV